MPAVSAGSSRRSREGKEGVEWRNLINKSEPKKLERMAKKNMFPRISSKSHLYAKSIQNNRSDSGKKDCSKEERNIFTTLPRPL